MFGDLALCLTVLFVCCCRHSFGGATALTAAFRRPDLIETSGGVIAHEPATDWLPDDARKSLLPLDRLEGLESSHNYTGGMGGLEYHKKEEGSTTEEEPTTKEPSLHDVNLLFMFSHQWRVLVCKTRECCGPMFL